MGIWRSSRLWRRASAIVVLAGLSGLIVFWRFSAHSAPVPLHPLRIGFESNPPVQIRTENEFSGLGVETTRKSMVLIHYLAIGA